MQVPVQATAAHIQQMVDLHLKPEEREITVYPLNVFKWIKFGEVKTKKVYKERVTSTGYSYDEEDNLSFITLNTSTGKKFEFQMTKGSGKPCFLEMTSKDTQLRFDVYYPEGELLKILTHWGNKVEKEFWDGTSKI
jgi:hypothetical protein